jgi:serine/threonine protein kinase
MEGRARAGLPGLLQERYFAHCRLRQADAALSARQQAELVAWEYRQRWQHGYRIARQEYVAALPELVSLLGEMHLVWNCPRCGRRDLPLCDDRAETVHCPACQAEHAVSALFPGGRLGEYELCGLLGRGGMGAVYLARHRRLGQTVALKTIRTDNGITPKERDRFAREIALVGRMHHPNLVEALYAGEEAGTLFLVMRYVEGIDLQQLLRRKERLPLPEACALAQQIAAGLDYIAQQGLVHRDIKPSNLMLTPAGVVKILDLGLARLRPGQEGYPGLTHTGAALGTPDYLAPEQANDATQTDLRADLYSLGCTLFALLAGRPPFAHRRQLYEKLKAHAEEPPADLRHLRPELPADLAKLVSRLLAKDPAARPQTPAAVATELASLATGADLVSLCITAASAETIAAPSQSTASAAMDTGAAEPPGSRVPIAPASAQRRRRRPLGVSAAVILGVGLVLAILLAPWSGSSPATSPAGPGGSEGTERAVVPVLIARFDAQHYARQPKGELVVPRGVLGEQTWAVHFRDQVRLHVELGRPAYLYLLEFNAAGSEQPLWPENDQEAPALVTGELNCPAEAGKGLTLDDEPRGGVQAFAVVASTEPLPPYKTWKAQRPALAWRRLEVSGEEEVVWKGNGQWLDEWSPRGVRSRKEELGGIGVIEQLGRSLRQAPGVAEVRLVAFPVRPNGRN